MLILLFSFLVSVFGETVVINSEKYRDNPQQAQIDSKVTYNQHGEPWDLGYAGHVDVELELDGDYHNMMYFWFQECWKDHCPEKKKDQKFILWLQGGPGGPGTFGSISELGQFWVNKVDKSKKKPDPTKPIDSQYVMQKRAYTWCREYNCLFVDQPVKTGYSYQTLNGEIVKDPDEVVYTKTTDDAMKQILKVLHAFRKVFGDYNNTNFYIGSESYGGIYSPHMAKVIFDYNHHTPKRDHIPLTGLLVGDPCIDPESQYLTYANTLYGMGLIDLQQKDVIEKTMAGSAALSSACQLSFDLWNLVFKDDSGGGSGWFQEFTGGSNTENVLLGTSPEEFDWFSDWMGFALDPEEAKKIDLPEKSQLQEAFHVDELDDVSHDEGGQVYSSMVTSGDSCQSTAQLFADLFVTEGLEMMIFSSTSDPLLGPPTTEAGVMKILQLADKLPGGEGLLQKYQEGWKHVWKADEEDSFPAGYDKCVEYETRDETKRFCYVVVRNAGHTTPSYQPRTSYSMFSRFVKQEFFEAPGDLLPSSKRPECGGCVPFAGPMVLKLECNTYRPWSYDPWTTELTADEADFEQSLRQCT